MLWPKKDIAKLEEYRLIASAESARESWIRVTEWRMYQSHGEAYQSQIPSILAELRYRYFLSQARKRNMINRWIGETMTIMDPNAKEPST